MSFTKTIEKNLLHELNTCQHLATKFTADQADWQPRENMRTTLQLMQYLCFIGNTMTKHFVNPPEDRDAAREKYRNNSKQAQTVTFENFSEWIDREKADIREVLANVTDADLQQPTYHPFSGEETTVFDALLTVVKYLAAYRHQLFLYAKMSGAEINTRNNWYGLDPAPPKQAAVAA